jgi:hypothetical protein
VAALLLDADPRALLDALAERLPAATAASG